MTREELLDLENKYHRLYFDPFDRLLEAKAEYYLNLEEKGESKPYLLREIETLERFRTYVEMLETIAQNHLNEIFRLSEIVLQQKEEKSMFIAWMKRDAELFDMAVEMLDKRSSSNE